MAQITKNLFLSTLTCPTYGWLQQSGLPQQPLSIADQLRIEEGLEIHERARQLFPSGILITGNNIVASQTTQQCLKDPTIDTIFEATFQTNNYVTKADILIRQTTGWKIIEIKSNVNLSDDLIDDLAYTTMVCKKAGLKISSCSLLLVSKDYRLGMPDKELFVEHKCRDDVFERIKDFEQSYKYVENILSQEEKPTPALKWECKSCDYYLDCHNSDKANTIFELPYCNASKFQELSVLNVFHIRDIPSSVKLSQYQQKVVKAVSSGKVVIDKEELKKDLASIKFPACHLDFETISTCIPLYSDTAPYTQIPTQYSIHKCSAPGSIVAHYEYLADHRRDCRRELAEMLIKDCSKNGSIITYTGFEERIIKGLLKLFPDLENKLNALLDRIVDLHRIIRNNYYDPEFHGSTSIKRVLPVMVPELSYEGMNIADGSDAMVVFAYLVKGRYKEGQVEQIRKDLLEYCKLDTLAMVRLEERLREVI